MYKDKSIRYLKGIGPTRCKAFKSLGIRTVGDLLDHYPRDWAFIKPYNVTSDDGDWVVQTGTVDDFLFNPRNRVTIFNVGGLRCVFFNQPFLIKSIRIGEDITVYGKLGTYGARLQLTNPKWVKGTIPDSLRDHAIPTYKACEKLPQPVIQRAVEQVLAHVDEIFAYSTVPGARMNLATAYENIHRPEYRQDLEVAKDTLKRQELYRLFHKAAEVRAEATSYEATPIPFVLSTFTNFTGSLPFTITNGQHAAMNDVAANMNSTHPMYRLIQGDVGCGKTIVAVYASVLAANHNMQTVVMCPTKILAEQHYRTWFACLGGCGYTIDLQTSDYTAGREHPADIIIGTTSVLNLDYPRLGLLIIDEEQKFGVGQKRALVDRYHPHQLLMTATPIPASILLTAFGDLDVTTIKDMPPGRAGRVTRYITEYEAGDMEEVIKDHVSEHHSQVYRVFPSIEGSEGVDNAYYARVDKDNVAIIHGQQTSTINNSEMQRFISGEARELYCTSMIEVGVDVPNANVMVIHRAHMFGLSQLHQLRGRIGRGSVSGLCFLYGSMFNLESSKLDKLVNTDDGFEIANMDLAIRGPGDIAGDRQTGLPELRLADLVKDFDLIKDIRNEVIG